jgi:hypothetical protein
MPRHREQASVLGRYQGQRCEVYDTFRDGLRDLHLAGDDEEEAVRDLPLFAQHGVG